MTDRIECSERDIRRLVVAITDFLRDQLSVREDFDPEDRDCLQIAIECLETAFGLENNGQLLYGSSRPLMDIYNQVTNPVSVKDKLRAESHKEEGNNYMRQRMFSNAETEYTNAINFDKWNAIYYANRASARIEQSNYFEAISDCRHALALNPDYAKAHSRMGQAYALIDRPREAARCFRQALQLEPDNEKYRNNLRAAESRINTFGAADIITTLLSSFFGIGPRNAEQSSSRTLPASFLIISESHPPTPNRPTETAEIIQNNENSQIARRLPANFNESLGNESPQTPFNSISNVSFQNPFGIIDEGTGEQPLQPFQPPAENPHDEEFVINIPLISFDVISEPESSQPERNFQNTEETNEQYSENIKKTDLELDNTNAVKNVNENNCTLFHGTTNESGNGKSTRESSQGSKYYPSGPEYIYHPIVNNNDNELQKGKKHCVKNNTTIETVNNEEKNKEKPRDKFPADDDFD